MCGNCVRNRGDRDSKTDNVEFVVVVEVDDGGCDIDCVCGIDRGVTVGIRERYGIHPAVPGEPPPHFTGTDDEQVHATAYIPRWQKAFVSPTWTCLILGLPSVIDGGSTDRIYQSFLLRLGIFGGLLGVVTSVVSRCWTVCRMEYGGSGVGVVTRGSVRGYFTSSLPPSGGWMRSSLYITGSRAGGVGGWDDDGGIIR